MSSNTATLAAAIAVLRVAYPGEFSDEAVAYYAGKLGDLDPGDVAGAVDRLTNRMRFRPTVADIRLEVASDQLGLPSVAEAWEIAERGSLRDAPAPVREAAEFVGGRWAITTSENPATIRAQFRHAYEHAREQALLEAAGAVRARSIPLRVVPALPPADPGPLSVPPPPAALMWHMAVERGELVGPPGDLERQNAMEVLRAGAWTSDPHEDMLYRAAEAVLHASDEVA
jgi:hypothetical protein